MLTEQCADADVIITTALIPNRPAPVLVKAETIAQMRSGSVIVDLAAENGGNCEGALRRSMARSYPRLCCRLLTHALLTRLVL